MLLFMRTKREIERQENEMYTFGWTCWFGNRSLINRKKIVRSESTTLGMLKSRKARSKSRFSGIFGSERRSNPAICKTDFIARNPQS